MHKQSLSIAATLSQGERGPSENARDRKKKYGGGGGEGGSLPKIRY